MTKEQFEEIKECQITMPVEHIQMLIEHCEKLQAEIDVLKGKL